MAHGKIGALRATFIVAGNMIGSGVYLLPQTLGAVGSSSMLGWLFASAGALLLAFCLRGAVSPASWARGHGAAGE